MPKKTKYSTLKMVLWFVAVTVGVNAMEPMLHELTLIAGFPLIVYASYRVACIYQLTKGTNE